LLQKLEESIEEPLISSSRGWGSWGFGYEIARNRLVSVSVNRRLSFGKMLEVVPDELCTATELRMVNFGTNQIKRIPREIGNLREVVRFFMGNNRIKIFPESLTQCSYIDILELQKNDIRQIPKNIGDMKGLVDLSLGMNKLSELPESIGELKDYVDYSTVTTEPVRYQNG
jgi:Leucine-rich repeat (LRR) protein